MPWTLKEQAKRAALDAAARAARIPVPLTDAQVEAWEKMDLPLALLPKGWHEPLLRYVMVGRPPQSRFLLALFENNLIDAVTVATAADLPALPELVQLLQHGFPKLSYGSPTMVSQWIEDGGLSADPFPAHARAM